MDTTLELACKECGLTIQLDREQQNKILAELTQPAHATVIECVCGQAQFILTRRWPGTCFLTGNDLSVQCAQAKEAAA